MIYEDHQLDMPRVYKKDPRGKVNKKIDSDALARALRDIKDGMSYRTAAYTYGIHYSVLFRHKHNPEIRKKGGQTQLSKTEENALIQVLEVCSEWGYPLDHYDLRKIVKQYLDSRGKRLLRFKDNMPGREFAFSFMKRHKDRLRDRVCQNIKRSRAAVSSVILNNYFNNLEKELEGVPPSHTVNFDETNLSDDPGRKKVISKRGCRYPERIMNTSKSATSIMFAAAGDGKLLPCYVVYKAQNLYDSWTVGGPKGTRYNRSNSGWFESASFEDWVEKIAIPYLKKLDGKKILIGDNLSSHFSPKTIRLCMEYNIHFVFLPPNSTHMTQPLDVAFFRPLKTAWRNVLLSWKKGEGQKKCSIPKDKFPHLLKNLLEEIHSSSESNIKSGFRKCGVCPINRQEVLSRLPEDVEEEDVTNMLMIQLSHT
ncbi:hypothetical protein PPYR_01414 [Photinus pyralis]|uniref:DDE-1 domain-containing protein n=1 Tax=Photinus pyralis TaxID=7054 RepID=A0A5N4B4G7_PHOPY|nr:hypothetical protein PPYR_01414 [Photinus pyralis]